jgi:hypothetical protein
VSRPRRLMGQVFWKAPACHLPFQASGRPTLPLLPVWVERGGGLRGKSAWKPLRAISRSSIRTPHTPPSPRGEMGVWGDRRGNKRLETPAVPSARSSIRSTTLPLLRRVASAAAQRMRPSSAGPPQATGRNRPCCSANLRAACRSATVRSVTVAQHQMLPRPPHAGPSPAALPVPPVGVFWRERASSQLRRVASAPTPASTLGAAHGGQSDAARRRHRARNPHWVRAPMRRPRPPVLPRFAPDAAGLADRRPGGAQRRGRTRLMRPGSRPQALPLPGGSPALSRIRGLVVERRPLLAQARPSCRQDGPRRAGAGLRSAAPPAGPAGSAGARAGARPVWPRAGRDAACAARAHRTAARRCGGVQRRHERCAASRVVPAGGSASSTPAGDAPCRTRRRCVRIGAVRPMAAMRMATQRRPGMAAGASAQRDVVLALATRDDGASRRARRRPRTAPAAARAAAPATPRDSVSLERTGCWHAAPAARPVITWGCGHGRCPPGPSVACARSVRHPQ